MAKTMIDFNKGIFYQIIAYEDEKGTKKVICEKTKHGRTVMSIIQLLRTFWIPSAEQYVRYLGVQCLNDDDLKHVFAFEGINA